MKKKKMKIKFISVGDKKDQEKRLSRVYDILFTEAAKKLKKNKSKNESSNN